jgi:hypothetical protein
MEAVRTSETSVDNQSLMMEAVRTSETSVDNHFTRQYNPEDSSERNKNKFMSHVSGGSQNFYLGLTCI